MQLSKLKAWSKATPFTRYTRENSPDKFARLDRYVLQDVRVEQAMAKRVVRLKPSEKELYWLDQEINDRGVPINLPLIQKANAIVEITRDMLDRDMRTVSNDTVKSTRANAQIISFLQRGGLHDVTSVAKEQLPRLLARDDLTVSGRAALELRQEAAKTSTAKLDSFETHMSPDGRVRGTIQFHGAATGRDAARGVQVQNFPRPDGSTDISGAIDCIMKYDADLLEALYGPPMSLIADCLRSMIEAPAGRKLYSQDLASIEARMTAWLAGAEDKLEAFRAFDRKEGPDNYIVAAAGIYNVPVPSINKDDPRRQVGKVSELALGFGGGAGAFGSMAKLYRVDLLPLYPIAWGLADSEERQRATEAWDQRGVKAHMKHEAWIAAEILKMKWRASNPEIVELWKRLEIAAVDAMLHPKTTTHYRGVRFRKTGSWLRMILPSDRSMFYAFPELNSEKTPWDTTKLTISFYGVDGVTRQWKKFSLWGGLITQNAVQATSRDVMMEALLRTEAVGYRNIMRVHDELVAETDEAFGSDKEYHDLVVEMPTWAAGLPVAASGWSGKRYRK